MFRANLERTGVYLTEGVPQHTGEKWSFQTSDPLASSPAVADGVVHFGSRDGHLYALDVETGQRKWRFSAYLVLASPTIHGGMVYFGGGNSLFKVDAKTGQEKWRVQTGKFIVSSAAVADGVVYFGTGLPGGNSGHLYALNGDTGEA